jgi:hypothetical protein
MQPGSSCFLLREGIMLHFTTSEILRVLLELSTERHASGAADSWSDGGA